MASNTYVALSTQTVTGSSAASVTFNSISSAYTDLVIVSNGTSSGDASFMMRFNGDTGTNYSTTYLYGTGSSAVSGRVANDTYIVGMGRTNTTGGASIIHLQNYSNTTTYKTVIGRGSAAASLVISAVGLWRSTSAINSITITPEGSNTIAVGTTFTIYGVAAASVGAKATGGTIYQDASYFYHAFAANGTFTPTQSLSCDVMLLAGGGGGGRYGGGGGGGGYRLLTSQSFSATGYSVTVGAGGAGGTGNDGGTGTASSVNSLSANPGGGGGGYDAAAPSGTYGSGGGGGYSDDGLTKAGAAGTAGQGYAGGTTGGNYYAGSGGGGAGSIGANSTSGRIGGNGGSGIALDSAFLAATGFGLSGYVAGGGGGCGQNGVGTGTAGGGTGATNNNGTAGLANTGGGGGGGYAASGGTNANGFAGGSGLVIVRYAK